MTRIDVVRTIVRQGVSSIAAALKAIPGIRNPSIWFVSYADSVFEKSRRRIRDEALAFAQFDHVRVWERDDVRQDLEKYRAFSHPRGGGYWLWKPYVIRRTLELMNDNDFLFYLDAGCTIHGSPAQKARFDGYVRALVGTPVLVCETRFQAKIGPTPRYLMGQWTKRDVIEGMRGEDFRNMVQICSGFLALRKCRVSVQLIDDWFNFSTANDSHFLDDSPSRLPEYEEFIEHRHDQSILNLLARNGNHQPLTDQILIYQRSEADADRHPFWAERRR